MGADIYLHLFNMRTYRERIVPAFQALSEDDDPAPLVALLKEIVTKLDNGEQPSDSEMWTNEVYEEAIGILDGSVYYNSNDNYGSSQNKLKTTTEDRLLYARENLSSGLLLALCLPRNNGVKPEQDMTNTALIPYLYRRSEWIKDMFTFVRPVRGGRLDIPIGDSSEVFAKQEVQEFIIELSKIPPPQDVALRMEHNNLLALLKLVSEDRDLTLVLSVS